MDKRIIKALRKLSDRIADDHRNEASKYLSKDTIISREESRNNEWKDIEVILKGE